MTVKSIRMFYGNSLLYFAGSTDTTYGCRSYGRSSLVATCYDGGRSSWSSQSLSESAMSQPDSQELSLAYDSSNPLLSKHSPHPQGLLFCSLQSFWRSCMDSWICM